MKFPLILFSLAAGYLIYRIALQAKASEKQALVAASLWLFNPVTLYSIAMMGQNDVMAIVFFLAGWLLLNKKRLLFVSILFGLAASVKMFPLVWLPFLLAADTRTSWKEKVLTFFASTGTYVLTLLPFISNPVFRDNVLNSGIERFFIARIELGYEKKVLLVPIMLMLTIMGAIQYYQKNLRRPSIHIQTTILLVMNAVMLFFNHFHPQWLTWLVPFWSIWILSLKKERLPLAALLSLSVVLAWGAIILLFKDAALSFGIFTPLNPDLGVLPSPNAILLQRGIETDLYMNYAHTWLAGIAISLLILWLQGKAVSDNHEWIKIGFSLPRFRKIIMLPVAAIVLLVTVFFGLFATQLFPVPASGPTPVILDYPPLQEPVEQEFTAEHDRLQRIDLYFSNDNLSNNDTFQFIVHSDNNTKEIWRQDFNGFNTGYRSSLRFDLPIQMNSKGKTYSVKIIPAVGSAEPLKIGSLTNHNPDNFALRPQYAKPPGTELLGYAVNEAAARTLLLFQQLKGLFIVLLLILVVSF